MRHFDHDTAIRIDGRAYGQRRGVVVRPGEPCLNGLVTQIQRTAIRNCLQHERIYGSVQGADLIRCLVPVRGPHDRLLPIFGRPQNGT